MNRSQDPEVFLKTLKLVGNKRTHSSVFEAALQPVYKSKTLSSLLTNLDFAANQLRNSDAFKSVQFHLDYIDEERFNDAINVKLNLEVEEKSIVSLGTETFVKSGKQAEDYDTGVAFSLGLRNSFGSGEKLSVSHDYTLAKKDTKFELLFQKPFLFNRPDVHLNVHVNNATTQHGISSSYDEETKNFKVEVFSDNQSKFKHTLGYLFSYRDILPLRQEGSAGFFHKEYLCSPEILKGALPSLKSSIFHKVSYLNTQKEGKKQVILETEIAGIDLPKPFGKSDSSSVFSKFFCNYKNSTPLAPNLEFCHSVSSGFIYNFQSERTHLSDRFFLGGISSFRGFDNRGLGPRARVDPTKLDPELDELKTDSLGGDAMWKTSAVLRYLLPVPNLDVSAGLHAGNLGSLKDIPTQKFLFGGGLSCSIDLGVKLPIGRLEISLAKVLQKRSWDQTRTFQIGLTTDFF
eukprot:maker-scaffold_15-snap-gene-8.3-mRNA-1 protein AED:0.16 eAED:0.16 QI:113/1/1/1/1/1/2/64/459